MELRKRRARFGDVFVLGLVLLIVSIAMYNDLPLAEAKSATSILILLGIIVGGLMLGAGFNFDRIKFSFIWSFISILAVIYVALIFAIDGYGPIQQFAVFLSPYIGVSAFGYLGERASRAFRARAVSAGVPLSTRIRAVIYQLDSTMWFFLIFGSLYLLIFMVIPILLVLWEAFTPPAGGEWWTNFYTVLRTRSYVKLETLMEFWQMYVTHRGGVEIAIVGFDYGPVINSLLVATIVTLTSTVLGIVIAFILARYRFPGHTLLRMLAIVPLFNTPFVNAYVIKFLYGPGGPFSAITSQLFGFSMMIDEIAGVIIAQVMAFYPIIYLNAYNSFINVDPSMEEQAENLGASGFKLFRSVTLPLALPGIVAGATLVFVFSLEDLGAPIAFNAKNLMSFKIYDGIITATGIISPEIAALGVLMLLLAVALFLAIRNYVSMRSYAMISRGGRWNPRVRMLGPFGTPIVYLIAFPLVIITMLPQLCVVLLSLDALKLTQDGMALDIAGSSLFYISRVLSDPIFLPYLRNTLVYATVSVVIAVFLATAIGYSVSRLKIKWLSNILDSLAVAPLAIPGLVMALGYYIFFMKLSSMLPPEIGLSISPVNPAFAAWLIFILSFSVRRLPYVVRSVFAGFQQVHENLEEAAMNLGASRYKVIFGIILPFIIGYILSGALLGFIYMATEVSTSVTFGGINEGQAPLTYYMRMFFSGGAGFGPQIAAAMGTILILLQLIVVVAIVYVFKQRYAFIGV